MVSVIKYVCLSTVESETNRVLKSYYVGGSDISMQASEAAMFCQSTGMVLASPESQLEYDNIRNLLTSTTVEWNQLQAELYLSEENKDIWMSRGKAINLNLSFIPGQPDNYNNMEDCLVFIKPEAKMIDVPCTIENRILCERSNHAGSSQHGNQADVSKYVKHIASYSFESKQGLITKRIHSNQKFLKTSWIEAHHICKSFGMDLFAPETEYEFNNVKASFEGNVVPFVNISNSFFIGATNLESESWYSIVSGEAFAYDFNSKPESSENARHCAMLRNVEGKFVSIKVSCSHLRTNFFCQERFVKPRHEDVEMEAVFTSGNGKDVDDNSSFTISWIYVPGKSARICGFNLKNNSQMFLHRSASG